MVRQHAVRGIVPLIAILLGSAGTSGQPDPAALSLDDQPRFERQIGGGQTHAYEVTLKAGDFLRLSIEPKELVEWFGQITAPVVVTVTNDRDNRSRLPPRR